ncbi:hypothetical protein WP8W18C01_44980 [Pseudomonas putida]|uniref:Uncharacterized protein n=1 Tax=Pseudomonas putida TaxID=303 RepID=A0A6S5ES29_PSEPU|nr:hypothetical protein WP4W18C03_43000 [Pseudomonas putida]BBT42157.1 hypothetical protein WP8W18C01_44980 [Pseudomonas putida]
MASPPLLPLWQPQDTQDAMSDNDEAIVDDLKDQAEG